MENGGWGMEDGELRVKDRGWRMVDGGLGKEDGEWRLKDGGWRVKDGGWRLLLTRYGGHTSHSGDPPSPGTHCSHCTAHSSPLGYGSPGEWKEIHKTSNM